VQEMIKALQLEIESSNNSVEFLEQSLEECEQLLHPNHFIVTGIKSALIDSYGHVKGYFFPELPDILLKRKIDLCEELLAILDIFERGKNRARALMMYELHAPLVLYAKSLFDVGHLSEAELIRHLEKARDILSESHEILEWEDENVCAIVKSAKNSLDNLSKLIESFTNSE
jgi:hypothetical protein